MKIIDFERKGHVVRFYLGEKTPEWGWTNKDYKRDGETPDWLKPSDTYYGDDWDDAPYEHNAGQVYDEFVKGYKDIAFDFDDFVIEPAQDYGRWSGNTPYSKDDMIDRIVPCIIVVPKELAEKHPYDDDSFSFWVGTDDDKIKKYYFGDEMESDLN